MGWSQEKLHNINNDFDEDDNDDNGNVFVATVVDSARNNARFALGIVTQFM